MPAEIGSKAPEFTLVNQDREPVRLGDELARHHVVLAFFPAAFSSVCTTELCTFRDVLARLNQANVAVFGISVDTPFALKAFAREQNLNFPLLSDFNKDVIRQYGVFNEDMIGLKGIAKRAVFLIDKSGAIRHRDVLDDARKEPDYGKLHEAIARL